MRCDHKTKTIKIINKNSVAFELNGAYLVFYNEYSFRLISKPSFKFSQIRDNIGNHLYITVHFG